MPAAAPRNCSASTPTPSTATRTGTASLVEHSRQSPATLVKTAVAVIAAHGEEQLRGGYRQPETYRALLGSLGYEPDDGEFPERPTQRHRRRSTRHRRRHLNAHAPSTEAKSPATRRGCFSCCTARPSRPPHSAAAHRTQTPPRTNTNHPHRHPNEPHQPKTPPNPPTPTQRNPNPTDPTQPPPQLRPTPTHESQRHTSWFRKRNRAGLIPGAIPTPADARPRALTGEERRFLRGDRCGRRSHAPRGPYADLMPVRQVASVHTDASRRPLLAAKLSGRGYSSGSSPGVVPGLIPGLIRE